MTPSKFDLHEAVARIDERTEIMQETIKDEFARGREKFDAHDERIRANQIAIRWIFGIGFGASAVVGIMMRVF